MTAWTLVADIEVEHARFVELARGFESLKELHERLVIQLQGYVYRNWPKKPPLSPLTLAARRRGGSAVLQDTGALRISISGESPFQTISSSPGTLNEAGESIAVIGTSLPYAAIHNYGGTIHARRVKNLSIPVTPEASAVDGASRFPRQLKFIPSKKSGTTGVLVEAAKRRGEKGKIQFILKPSVRIPQRRCLPDKSVAEKIANEVAEDYVLGLLEVT